VHGSDVERRLSGRVGDSHVGAELQQVLGVGDLAEPGGGVQRRGALAVPRPLRVIQARPAAPPHQQRQHLAVALTCNHTPRLPLPFTHTQTHTPV